MCSSTTAPLRSSTRACSSRSGRSAVTLRGKRCPRRRTRAGRARLSGWGERLVEVDAVDLVNDLVEQGTETLQARVALSVEDPGRGRRIFGGDAGEQRDSAIAGVVGAAPAAVVAQAGRGDADTLVGGPPAALERIPFVRRWSIAAHDVGDLAVEGVRVGGSGGVQVRQDDGHEGGRVAAGLDAVAGRQQLAHGGQGHRHPGSG
jgi:hypothetical protein